MKNSTVTWALLLTALSLLASPPANAQTFFGERVEGTLCRNGETVMFACPSQGKRMAVCASPSGGSPFGFLRYRFGDDQNLELEFPLQPKPLRDYASGNHLGDGARGSLTYLRLLRGDVSYAVFSEVVNPSYQQAGASERNGVIVERHGKVLARHMCDADARIYSGMLLDPKFLDMAVPLDQHGLIDFPAYRP